MPSNELWWAQNYNFLDDTEKAIARDHFRAGDESDEEAERAIHRVASYGRKTASGREETPEAALREGKQDISGTWEQQRKKILACLTWLESTSNIDPETVREKIDDLRAVLTETDELLGTGERSSTGG